MQIDWLTVAAQAVNFLVLVHLLRRFLYQPVVAAMARREERIAQQLQEAAQREQQALEETQAFQEKNQAFERDRAAMLSRAEQEVEAHRKTLLEAARQEADASRRDWHKEVERERLEFLRMFRQRAAQSLTQTARRMLADMADVELEQQLIHTFVKQLDEVDHELLTSLRKTAHKASMIRVTTSFEADPDTRARIKRAIQHHLLEGHDTPFEFVRSDELLCGIEVNTDGRKLGWTLQQYLHTLEQDLSQLLAQTVSPPVSAAPSEQTGA